MNDNKFSWYPTETSDLKFPYSSYISIKKKDNKIHVKLNNPAANMQTDAASFESIALMCRCIDPGCKVEIDFALSGWEETIDKKKVVSKGWNGEFGKKSSKSNAYLRFLYRAGIFKHSFDWVSFSDVALAEVVRFAALLANSLCSNNIPYRMAEYNKDRTGEYAIEYKLAHSQKGKRYLNDVYYEKAKKRLRLETINNQLPNGLFTINTSGVPNEENRIFTTGAYDIWAIDEDGYFCVFELKKESGNEKLGIVSELFFYATYAHDVLLNKNRLHEPKLNYRGYGELFAAVQENRLKGVKAFFLLAEDGMHKYIDKAKLLNELNRNMLCIPFDFLCYDPNVINGIFTDEVNEGVKIKSKTAGAAQ